MDRLRAAILTAKFGLRAARTMVVGHRTGTRHSGHRRRSRVAVTAALSLLVAPLATGYGQRAEASTFTRHPNGVTILCPSAAVGDTGTVDGVTYTKRTRDQITDSNAATTCTSGITDMSRLFENKGAFNGDISHWDTSSVTTMLNMFDRASVFNQPIGG